MKPITILKDLVLASVFAAMLYMINCVEPIPTAISSIFTGAVTAKSALVLITTGFVIHRIASLIFKSIGGKYYGLLCMLRRY